MSRNTDSHFGNVPSKNIGRSSFKMPFTHSTTCNTGDIIPIYAQEYLPGDTAKVKLSLLVRMQTPIAPVMDNAWIDTYFFAVPRRLVWEHWKEFMGENTTDAWTEETEYQIPQLVIPENGFAKGTIGEKLYGIQGRAGGLKVDACYTRAYTLIFNEWFRNQNVTEPAELSRGDSDTTGSNGNSYVTDLQKGGMPAKAVKYADYFTRALPEPQKGPDVYLPLGERAPLVPTDVRSFFVQTPNGNIEASMRVKTGAESGSASDLELVNRDDEAWDALGRNVFPNPAHLSVDLANATAATINQLRQAFAIQRMYEVDARGGTRYTEILRAHFGVISPDARQQRPEYLGGKRVPINISQVIQQSATDSTSPQGTAAAYSLTIDTDDMFTKSFDEHGILLGLAVIRTEHTYQQGIARQFSRKNRVDFYWPELSNIGEQYIKNKEIFAQGTSEDEEAFGYQEAWAEYRYANNKVTGELNSDYAQSLDLWTYADDYSQLPTLSDDWIRETDSNVSRTLAIQNQDQFLLNMYFDQTWVRPMPIYSIPSLTGWN